MLFREMSFVFHKSKQALNVGDIEEIVKEDKYVPSFTSVLMSDFVLC